MQIAFLFWFCFVVFFAAVRAQCAKDPVLRHSDSVISILMSSAL